MIIASVLLLLLGLLYVAMVFRYLTAFANLPEAGEPEGDAVFLSVVVAARNEAGRIEGLLCALLRQDYSPGLFEVIVVDDHSDDSTAAVVTRFASRHGMQNLRLLQGAEAGTAQGKKHALALGISKARGDYVVTTDADCLPGRGWLKAMAAHLSETDSDMLLGPVRMVAGTALFSKLQALEHLSLAGIAAGSAGSGRPVLCSGANLAFRKAVFEEVGGYRSHLSLASGDDVFLLQSFRQRSGTKVTYVKDRRAIVDTRPVRGLKAFFKQRARWVSKSGGYTDKAVIAAAVVVAGLNAGLLAAAAVCIVQPGICSALLTVFLAKFFVDFFLLFAVAGFFGQRKLLWLYTPLSLLYPFYVCFSMVSGSFRRRGW